MNRDPDAASDTDPRVDSHASIDETPETKPYLHVRPTGTLLDPQTLAAQFERLHGLVEVTNSGASGVRDALFETTTLRGALAIDERTAVRLEVLLVLCPNHHVDFDYGMVRVDPRSLAVDHAYDSTVHAELEAQHEVGETYLNYHNAELANSF